MPFGIANWLAKRALKKHPERVEGAMKGAEEGAVAGPEGAVAGALLGGAKAQMEEKEKKPGLLSRFGSAAGKAKGKIKEKAGAGKEWAKGKYSGWKEKRKEEKEAGKGAREEAKASAKEERFAGIRGEYEKAEEFKGKLTGWIKKIILGILLAVSVMSIIFGSMLPAIIAIAILVLLGMFWFKGYSRGIIIIIIIFIIIFAIWSQTGTGKLLSAQAGRTMPLNYEAARAVTGPLNIVKQVLLGTYDPTEIWNSKTYEDKYAPYKDVGVKIADVRPLRDTSVAGGDIIVVGRISAKSLPDDEEGMNIEIVKPVWVDAPLGRNLGEWDECEPRKVEKMQAYYTRFECTCPGSKCLGDVKGIETHTVEISVDYAFTQRAGKQIYVANYDELARLYMQDENPVAHYKLSSSELASWQTESPIGLGMGVKGDEDIIATDTTYYLGISITNNGVGDVREIKNLEITMPCDIDAKYNAPESDFKKSPNPPPGLPIELCVYMLKGDVIESMFKNVIGGYQPIGPAEVKSVFLPFKVDEAYLQKSAISSFFAKVDMRFVYKDKENVAITVVEKPT